MADTGWAFHPLHGRIGRGLVRMKRIISIGLVCLFLCLSGSAIWTEAGASEARIETKDSSPENEYTYLAILNRFFPHGSLWEYIEKVDGIDEGRDVNATLFSSMTVDLLLLPEGSGTEEAYTNVGARVTFDKPFDTFLSDNGLEGLLTPSIILEPKRLEIVGDCYDGVIVEIGEDYVMFDIYNDDFLPSGNLIRVIITPDTLLWGADSPIQEGSGGKIVVDKDGVVLAMINANG